MSTTVVLVDDHELIRKACAAPSSGPATSTLSARPARSPRRCKVIADTSPDVAIFDVRLPDGSGLDVARTVRESHPTMGIVVLTMYAGDDQLFGALEAGASAFVPKDAPAEDVVAAARHAAVSPRAFTASDLADAMQRRLSPTGPQLSPREKEVLGLLADGLGVAGISKQLFISESTTKTHISKVYEKLGAGNRAQALMTAMRLGLIANPAEHPH